MSLTTVQFFLFIIVGCLLFYLVPKRFQWVCLLGLSYFFFCYGGIETVIYIIATTITVWGGALLIWNIEKKTKRVIKETVPKIDKEEKKRIKKKCKTKKLLILWSILLINLGILSYFKYTGFVLENFFGSTALSALILPLGISFYTFQSISYIMDVYWEKIEPDKNLFKFALYISFFPQIIQGPIARHSDLAKQLYGKHVFDLEKIEYGVLRMLWGYFKKMVIADRAGVVVNCIFDQPDEYGGAIALVGALFYAIQQYADFSGGIDVVIGVGELFDIRMTENFSRPYFSRSLAEFWRRWHITLGAWMRDYVFYPLAMTSPMRKLGQICKKLFGEHVGKVAPVALGNIVVFFLVGVWHGAQGHYVLWGLYNGIIIAISALLEPVYNKTKALLHIKQETTWFALFGIVRTFLIVTYGGFFDRATEVRAAFLMIGRTFLDVRMHELTQEMFLGFGLSIFDYIILLVTVIVLFGIEIIQERKAVSIRKSVMSKPLLIRWIILYIFIFSIIAFMFDTNGGGGFMYAQF